MTFLAAFKPRQLFGPNGLTLFRAFAALILPFWLLSEKPSLHLWAIALFTLAAFSDFFDGLIARRFKLETRAGRFMDPLADKMLTLGCMAVFAIRGYYSPWFLVPIFTRELLVTFFRIGWLIEGQAVAAESLGKFKHGVQTALISSSILLLNTPHVSVLSDFAGSLHALQFVCLWLSLVFSVVSGITFCRNQRRLFLTPFFAKYVCAMGVGLLKPAPGTWGSLLAALCILITAWNPWLYGAVGLIFIAAGFWAFPRLEGQGKDPGFVVLDEAAGMFVTLALLPLSPATVLGGFLLFRLFDILKPFPLRRLEKLPGFWGVLLDDIGAGIYAWLCLWLFLVR